VVRLWFFSALFVLLGREGLHDGCAMVALSSEWQVKLADVYIDNEDTRE
jgi:hypothetical protein